MSYSAIITVAGGAYVFERGDGILVQASCAIRRGKKASNLTATVADPGMALANSFPLPRKNQKVLVEAWYGQGAALVPVFSGYLATISANTAGPRFQFTAVDKSKGGRRKTKARSLAGRAVADICREVAERAELEGGVVFDDESALDIQLARYVQLAQTDMEMLHAVLEPLGYTAFTEGDTLYVRSVAAIPDEASYVFTYGEAVDVTFSADDAVPKTAPNVFTFAGDQVSEGEAGAEDRPVNLERTGLLVTADDFPSFTDENVQRAAQAQKRKARVFEAEATSPIPLPDATLDSVVQLRGYGERWSGVYLIEAIDHNMTRGTTRLDLYNSGVE